MGLANGSDDLILVGVADVFLGKQKDGKQRRIKKRKETSHQATQKCLTGLCG